MPFDGWCLATHGSGGQAGDELALHHQVDTLIGALLIIAGAAAIGYTVNGSRTWRTLSIIGAGVAIIIGVLLILGLA